jgi:hypothetical protein
MLLPVQKKQLLNLIYMKSIKLIPFLLLLLLSSSFTTEEPEKLIIGKWKLDVKASEENYNKIFVSSKDEEADKVAKSMMSYMFMILGNTVSDYKENGELINTTSVENPDGTVKTKITNGTWKLSADKKSLLMNEKNQESTLEVISIAKDKMELSMKTKKISMTLVYIPAEL